MLRQERHGSFHPTQYFRQSSPLEPDHGVHALRCIQTQLQDNDGDVSEADTAEVPEGADDVAVGDVTTGLDDSFQGGDADGGGDGGGEGGRYDNGGEGDMGGAEGPGGENMLDISMEPTAMVPQVGCGCFHLVKMIRS